MSITIDESTPFGERVSKRLRGEHIIWLTTVSPAGDPHPRPVWFLWDGESFLIDRNRARLYEAGTCTELAFYRLIIVILALRGYRWHSHRREINDQHHQSNSNQPGDEILPQWFQLSGVSPSGW